MPKTSVITLREFRSMSGKVKPSFAIHLTPAQWKKFTAGATLKDLRDEKARGFQMVDLPGRDGLLIPVCPSPCEFRAENGKFRCSCTDDSTQPPGGGGLGEPEFCVAGLAADGAIRCTGSCRQNRTCRPAFLRDPRTGVSYFVGCRCGRS